MSGICNEQGDFENIFFSCANIADCKYEQTYEPFECYHIKHRSIIESDWGTLKNNFQLEYHKARSIVGMFRHFFYSIATYMINPNLDF